jgi:DNA-binding response OmpR family regulator
MNRNTGKLVVVTQRANAASLDPQSPLDDRTKPGRILVVDDKPEIRAVLTRALSRKGHEVVVAENGRGGIAALHNGVFDLIVVDRNLPDLDGLDILKAARAKQPRAKTIMITGLPTTESETAARSLGVHDYLIKPFDVQDIVSQCESAIEASRRP